MRLVAALVLSVLALPSVSRASTVEAMDLRALVTESDHIALVTVVDAVTRYDHLGRIVTDYTVRVDERMHGASVEGRTLVLRRLGGALGDIGLRVEGEVALETGERVVLFARELVADGVCRPVGMSQGVMSVRHEGSSELVMPGGDGLSLMTRGAGGRLVPGRAALAAPTSLDELRDRVRELVREIHGAR